MLFLVTQSSLVAMAAGNCMRCNIWAQMEPFFQQTTHTILLKVLRQIAKQISKQRKEYFTELVLQLNRLLQTTPHLKQLCSVNQLL